MKNLTKMHFDVDLTNLLKYNNIFFLDLKVFLRVKLLLNFCDFNSNKLINVFFLKNFFSKILQ